MPTQFVTPVGRIVWGHPLKPQIKKDQKTKQIIMRDGNQVQQWVFGLAIPKDQFVAQVWPQMSAEAATLFPNGVPSNFSWKYKDGDGVDASGKPYNTREGYAGHYVLTISTEAFSPQVFKHENGAYRQLAPEEIKTGDFVAVNLTLVANKPKDIQNTPGLYVNPNGIVFVGYGAEIVSAGSNPDELFAGAQFALPAGASAAPLMPAAPLPGAPAPLPQPQYAPQPLPAAAPQPQYAPAPLPAPAPDFVHNAGAPAPLPQPQYAPAPAGGVPPMPGMPTGR